MELLAWWWPQNVIEDHSFGAFVGVRLLHLSHLAGLEDKASGALEHRIVQLQRHVNVGKV
eukprot:55066-Prymnesium_polylepis.1